MIPAYIISLAYTKVSTVQGRNNKEHAEKRIHRVESTARSFGWNIQPFSAVDGYSLDPSTLTQDLTPGELGCALSHLRLWKLCQSQNTPMIVLEDDVQIIAECTIPHTEYELLKLHPARKITGKSLLRKHKMSGVWGPGAYAYYLTPSAADKLINWIDSHGLLQTDRTIGSNVINYGHVDHALIRLIPHSHSSTRVNGH